MTCAFGIVDTADPVESAVSGVKLEPQLSAQIVS